MASQPNTATHPAIGFGDLAPELRDIIYNNVLQQSSAVLLSANNIDRECLTEDLHKTIKFATAHADIQAVVRKLGPEFGRDFARRAHVFLSLNPVHAFIDCSWNSGQMLPQFQQAMYHTKQVGLKLNRNEYHQEHDPQRPVPKLVLHLSIEDYASLKNDMLRDLMVAVINQPAETSSLDLKHTEFVGSTLCRPGLLSRSLPLLQKKYTDRFAQGLHTIACRRRPIYQQSQNQMASHNKYLLRLSLGNELDAEIHRLGMATLVSKVNERLGR